MVQYRIMRITEVENNRDRVLYGQLMCADSQRYQVTWLVLG